MKLSIPKTLTHRTAITGYLCSAMSLALVAGYNFGRGTLSVGLVLGVIMFAPLFCAMAVARDA